MGDTREARRAGTQAASAAPSASAATAPAIDQASIGFTPNRKPSSSFVNHHAAHNPAALPSTALDNTGAFVSRQRDAALENLDAAIAALPASQQAPLRLIQQLLN